ncbi:MAG: type II toxin-antitoxin system Phd/YefM family antitoxin [Candidatus Pacebacteria bacterium]|nr:type II toxin-antitoxin system Phd/YefM family antitoxin [Candidatus Paceibacterota bacterium]
MNKKLEKILPASEARRNFFAILRDAQNPGCVYTITLDGRPKAVVLSSKTYDAWKETISIVKDGCLAKGIRKAQKEVDFGDYFVLDEILKENGYVLCDEQKRKYSVRAPGKKRGKKP